MRDVQTCMITKQYTALTYCRYMHVLKCTHLETISPETEVELHSTVCFYALTSTDTAGAEMSRWERGWGWGALVCTGFY